MRAVLLRMSTQVRIPDLWHHLPWAALLHSSWNRPDIQRDAAEYPTSLLEAGSTDWFHGKRRDYHVRCMTAGGHGPTCFGPAF